MNQSDRPTVSEVVDKLAALGSGRQIAEFFETEGITGLPGSSASCPVASYIFEATGVYSRTYPEMILTDAGITRLAGSREPIRDFIRAFDSNEFPELER